jgi:crotonobetainyl-CoA:carnitine CoA-transferase CaiB-like acyl-CoA transferase
MTQPFEGVRVIDRPPAAPGEHNEDVLREAGYSAEEIETSRSDGVF